MKKILLSDMDGTIVDGFHVRHVRDVEMLHELQKQGHFVAFDTGRNEQEAHFCIDKHHFPYDYLILNNGAHIVDRQGKEIYKKIIPQDIGRKIIEYCLNYNDLFIFFYNGNRTIGYYNHQTYEHTENGNVAIDDLDFMEEYLKVEEFDIIAIFQANEKIDQTLLIQQYIQEHFGEYALGCLNTHFLDITATGCSKGSGIVALQNILGDVETYAIGDSYNDISMFEVANHAYTFHHVPSQIQQYTSKQVDYVYEVIEDMLK